MAGRRKPVCPLVLVSEHTKDESRAECSSI